MTFEIDVAELERDYLTDPQIGRSHHVHYNGARPTICDSLGGIDPLLDVLIAEESSFGGARRQYGLSARGPSEPASSAV